MIIDKVQTAGREQDKLLADIAKGLAEAERLNKQAAEVAKLKEAMLRERVEEAVESQAGPHPRKKRKIYRDRQAKKRRR